MLVKTSYYVFHVIEHHIDTNNAIVLMTANIISAMALILLYHHSSKTDGYF